MYLGQMRWVGTRKKYREESPLYRQTKTDISNGEIWVIDVDTGTYKKYAPYNYCNITNNTNRELFLYLDDKVITIPSGVIKGIDEETIPAFRSIRVANLSGNDATGNIEILFQKVISQRMILRKALL